MGDRVLLQVVKKEPAEFSPVLYSHWRGGSAVDAVHRTARRMQGRPGDVPYIAARLFQELVGNDDGDTGFGLMLADKVLTAEDSHGDAGVILVDADTFKMTFLGGYLARGRRS